MTRTNAREAEDERRSRQIVRHDVDIRIARDGTWFHEGSAIDRRPLVKLFAGILRREGDEYFLETPVEKARIRVEDAPFVAVEVTSEGEGRQRRLTFRTNIGEEVTAGPDHPIRIAFDPATQEPSPYVLVRDGLEALIARPVYYELVAMGTPAEVDGREVLGIHSGGAFYVLGATDDAA